MIQIIVFVIGYVLVAIGIAVVYLRIGKINFLGVTETRPDKNSAYYYAHNRSDYYTSITLTSIAWPMFMPLNVFCFIIGVATGLVGRMAKFVEKD